MNIKNISDERLIEILVKENKEFFSEIVRRYQNKIFYYVYRLVNDKEEAEDLTQEIFIKVYRNLKGFDTKRKFSSWIYRIAHNESVNLIKKKSYFKILSIEQNEFLSNTMASAENIIEKIIKKEKAELLKKILGKLPFKYKEVLVLRYFEEKSYDEISDILRMPVNTVGTLINRAKIQVEKIIKHDKIEIST